MKIKNIPQDFTDMSYKDYIPDAEKDIKYDFDGSEEEKWFFQQLSYDKQLEFVVEKLRSLNLDDNEENEVGFLIDSACEEFTNTIYKIVQDKINK